MSLRDHFLAVKSIDQLRGAIASGDAKLRANLAGQYEETLAEEYGPPEELDEDGAADLEERREAIATALDRVIMGPTPPETEHGDWAPLFGLIADAKGLDIPYESPIDTYKHTYTWGPYRDRLRRRIPDRVDGLLRLIEDGRPLLGRAMESDWTMYAWLDRAEIADMLHALSDVDFGDDDRTGLLDFHKGLIATLAWLRENDAEVLMVID